MRRPFFFFFPVSRLVQEIEDHYCTEGVWGKNLLTFNELSDFVNEASPNLKKKRISRTQVSIRNQKSSGVDLGET